MDLRRQKLFTVLQFLTLAPHICYRESMSAFFGVTEYLIRESREVLKKTEQARKDCQ